MTTNLDDLQKTITSLNLQLFEIKSRWGQPANYADVQDFLRLCQDDIGKRPSDRPWHVLIKEEPLVAKQVDDWNEKLSILWKAFCYGRKLQPTDFPNYTNTSR